MQGCDVVIHLAGGVSVEASYREPARFFRTNSLGTAVLWQAVQRTATVKHVVVASSMSVYGEGFDDRGVTEDHPCRPESLYGWSKYDTEQISLLAGRLYGIETTALRIWNTYGPGQSLTNGETGVIAIFAARLLTGEVPIIFDNGTQLRDFVHVTDVAQAFELVVRRRHPGLFNVGTGAAVSVLTTAELLCSVMSPAGKQPVIAHRHRPGDVTHCFPNVQRIKNELGWKANIRWIEGLTEYARNLRPLRLQFAARQTATCAGHAD